MTLKKDQIKREAMANIDLSKEFLLITKHDEGYYILFTDLLESGEMIARYADVFVEQLEQVDKNVTDLLQGCGVYSNEHIENELQKKYDDDLLASTSNEREEAQDAEDFFNKLVADEDKECKNAKSDKPKKED